MGLSRQYPSTMVVVLKVLWLGTLFSFLTLPMVLLWKHSRKPEKYGWGKMILVMMGGGWLLANASVHLHSAYLDALVESLGGDAPQELVDRLLADGAGNVFALLFGWLYGFFYFLPFAALYEIGRDLRLRWKRNRQNEANQMI